MIKNIQKGECLPSCVRDCGILKCSLDNQTSDSTSDSWQGSNKSDLKSHTKWYFSIHNLSCINEYPQCKTTKNRHCTAEQRWATLKILDLFCPIKYEKSLQTQKTRQWLKLLEWSFTILRKWSLRNVLTIPHGIHPGAPCNNVRTTVFDDNSSLVVARCCVYEGGFRHFFQLRFLPSSTFYSKVPAKTKSAILSWGIVQMSGSSVIFSTAL